MARLVARGEGQRLEQKRREIGPELKREVVELHLLRHLASF
ncbi:MAG TPA: hypothetical protein VNN10_01520 [Dehalococcoidia bacterium]|nr:hypothetical protein [Dehalococcoidia bacterium]